MFREMRRKDRALSQQEATEILTTCGYGILSTISPNGYPYGIPVNYVYESDAVYFHCALTGEKLDNIAADSHVSFCAVAKAENLPAEFATAYESVVIFGKAVPVSGEERSSALLALIKKYSPDYLESGKEYIQKMDNLTQVIKIVPDHITAKGRK